MSKPLVLASVTDDTSSEQVAAAERSELPLSILYVGDDDPDKCTARRLAKFDLAELLPPADVPDEGLLLDPTCGYALAPDLPRPARIVAVDCSWESVDTHRVSANLTRRALPYLLAGNPINFGHPFALTTAEAIAATVYILGDAAHAAALLAPFSWGHTFLELNEEPLERYAAAADAEAVIAIQQEYMDRPR